MQNTHKEEVKHSNHHLFSTFQYIVISYLEMMKVKTEHSTFYISSTAEIFQNYKPYELKYFTTHNFYNIFSSPRTLFRDNIDKNKLPHGLHVANTSTFVRIINVRILINSKSV